MYYRTYEQLLSWTAWMRPWKSWLPCVDALGDDEVVEMSRRVEAVKRRLVPVDHAVLNQLQSRSVPFTHGCRTAVMFVSNLLRIARGGDRAGAGGGGVGFAPHPDRRAGGAAVPAGRGRAGRRCAFGSARRGDHPHDRHAARGGRRPVRRLARSRRWSSTAGIWTRACWIATPARSATAWIRTGTWARSGTATAAASTCTAAPTGPRASRPS